MKLLLLVLIGGVFCASAQAETFKIDPAHSTIGFQVHQFLGTAKGKFTHFSGTIDVDREHPERSSVEATIQVASIDTGINKRDDHLRSVEFFNVAKYAQATFKSRTVKQTGAQSGDIAGDLTMHGVTKPVTLHVKLLTPLGNAASMQRSRWEVTADPLKRGDFGLMFSSTAETLSGIGQDVTLNMTIEATKGH